MSIPEIREKSLNFSEKYTMYVICKQMLTVASAPVYTQFIQYS